MVTVPEYQSNVATRPIFQSKLDVKADAENFGAAIGRGMVKLSEGMEKLETSISNVKAAKAAAAEAEREKQQGTVKGAGAAEQKAPDPKALDNVMRAKDRETQLAAWDRNARYGEGGFMTLTGQAAVDGRADYERRLMEKRKEIGADLTGEAAELYGRAADARINASLQSAVVYSGQQRKVWFQQNAAQRVDSFARDAVVNFTRPDLVTKNVAAGLLELQEQGRLEGWSGDTMMARGSAFVSGVHRDITLRLAEDDPIAADHYRNDHAGQMTGADSDMLTEALEGEISNEHSKREAGAILTRGRQVSTLAADAAGDLVDAGESTGRTVADAGPTRFRQALAARAAGGGAEAVDRLGESFAMNLAAMIEDAPPAIRDGLEIIGSAKGAANAVDLGWNGRPLKSGAAPRQVFDYVHDNAARYGMYFPITDDPEQAAPFSTRGGTVAPRGNKVSPRALGPSADDIDKSLADIRDEKVRQLTQRRIQTTLETQARAEDARIKQAKAELWRAIDEGKTPDDVPREIRQVAGMEAVSAAWNYMQTAAKGRAGQVDEVLLYDMRRYAAMDPDGFAEVDLSDYRGRLGGAFSQVADLQVATLTRQAEVKREGLQLAKAFAESETQLEAVGITANGKHGAEQQAAIQQIARFQNALAAEMAAFKKVNNGKSPSELDISSMRNELLLPLVLREPRFLWWDNERVIPAFEVITQPENSVIEVLDWADLPVNSRQALELDLARKMGERPTEAQVKAYYKDIAADSQRTTSAQPSGSATPRPAAPNK
ncbi:hypothetical protein CO670_17065 [Rhizobium sp. J15]|uniref:hypothetical protein n=1 Tax=Rhizobium sp. J15 TaxID=2035450 RepID=UPI000BE7EF81|nr:hypothetical protein [Rhizobium sp. J15]PDT15488.1 hypothetical protein CO670_17065 [Rhizobium sp. J15]